MRSRRSELEIEDRGNNYNISASLVGHQTSSCHLQDVEIQIDEGLASRSGDPLSHQSEATLLRRRDSIQSRLSSPRERVNRSPILSPNSQNRVPVSLRLGEIIEELREVSISNATIKRRVGRGGSTSRGRGRG